MPQDCQTRLFRFGVFEANLPARELRKHGVRVRLAGQPYRILSLLLERPGEVITRDEMRRKLWPSDTFVDFEHSLNSAVKKLRAALGDSPENSRYVETIPRVGYRFIAPVEEIPPVPPQDGSQAAPTMARKVSGSERRLWSAVVSAVVGVMLAAGIYFLYSRRAPKLTERDTVVLADFANHTSDPLFDDTLKTALSVSLRQSPFLNVLSDDKVAATLELMARPRNSEVTPDVAREVCQRVGSKAYIAGSVANLGSEYVLGVKAVGCQSGETLAQELATAASKEKVLDALGEAASKLRAQVGESLASLHRFDVPLPQATTSSLDALKAYSLGQKNSSEKGPAEALPFHQRAIEIDSNFAMGYRAVGYDYYDLNQSARASAYFTKSFQLREHASERERLAITAHYYRHVTGELDRAVQTDQELIQSYPREGEAYRNLGTLYGELGRYEKAAEVTRHALEIAPDDVILYGNLAAFALALQRLSDPPAIIHEAEARNLDDYVLHDSLYAVAFLGADSKAMEKQQQWYTGRPSYEGFGLALASETEAYAGHLVKARELTQRAVESAKRNDNAEVGAIRQANAAIREAAYGYANEARRTAADALSRAPTNGGVASEAALAFSMANDPARAESLLHNLEDKFPLNTQVQSLWLPAIRAQVALDKKDAALAINALKADSPIDLGNIAFLSNLSCLYHVYVRGGTYLAARHGSAAADEFQKIIDHSGIVWNCWTGALAHLGIARAYALEAKTSQGADADAARVRALAAYKDFLTLWKDADPDIPVLKQAKAEYAKLQ